MSGIIIFKHVCDTMGIMSNYHDSIQLYDMQFLIYMTRFEVAPFCSTPWKWISNISKGSAATYLRCDCMWYMTVGHALLFPTVKELWKLVKI